MTEEPHILVSERDAILELVLNRPRKLNALSEEIHAALHAAADRLMTDPAIRVLLIRANGKYFSAGIDLSSNLAPDRKGDVASPMAFRRWYREGAGSLHPLGDRFEAIEKPVVVAHQGPCLGGAMELSLCCDFRLASESASYALPETALGCLPGSGGTSRLTRLCGPQWARWFIMANLGMDAHKASQIGLVHDVYPDAEFVDRVWDFCRNLAAQPPETVGTAKLAIELTADLDRASARNVERLAQSGLIMGDEYTALFNAMRDRVSAKTPT